MKISRVQMGRFNRGEEFPLYEIANCGRQRGTALYRMLDKSPRYMRADNRMAWTRSNF